ncbi:hypothetical protein B0H17DRAFT_1002859 [Mycena rosella]|uniref:DUF6699 domain-containing protein n=1 Tax=Mycena rosella TaxID=1033263 RepID=A0AAD7M7U4_MYCRO|nr:hypothetical protein B0H17DRAFT_1002859 [Mycena rosella]
MGLEAPISPRGVDHIGPFEAGLHYGPVLDPLQIYALRVALRLNPLLQPLAATGARPELKWDMRLPSSDCRRSGDPMYMAWRNGRHESATFPRVTSLRLVSGAISVAARNPDVGVTCGEFIDGISRHIDQLLKVTEYDALPGIQKDALRRAYLSRADGVPGGKLMRRLDCLRRNMTFGGLWDRDALACTFELVCIPHDPQRRLGGMKMPRVV